MLPLLQVKKKIISYFLEALEGTMNLTTLKKTIIMSDFNSQVGEREEYEYEIMSP